MNIKISRRQEADVAVIGGGTAGVFAAIAAARCGAKTVLFEKNSRLGGTLTTAHVNYPGLFYAWGHQIIDGPCWESILRTARLGGAHIPAFTYQPQNHWDEQIRVNKLLYTYVLNEMCREAGVSVLTNAMISYAEEQEESLRLFLTDKSGLLECHARVAIDTTGDANLTQILQYACVKSDQQQPATLYNHLSGYRIEDVDFNELKEKLEKHPLPHAQTIDAHRLIHALHTRHLDVHVTCKDADTSEGKTQLESDAIAGLADLYQFLRTIGGLEQLSIDFVADETGVRESNRIVGEKEILASEYLEGFFYPDSVCYAFYPIDLHIAKGIENTYLKEGVIPKIPYGALIPKGSRRLICAGRCVSSDTYANSALRVQAPCMAMGQAAGCAAALAAAQNVSIGRVPYQDLCASLETIGAIVPKRGLGEAGK